MDAFDQGVLRDDDAVHLRRVVLDCLHKAAAFELVEQTELAEVSEPLHRRPRATHVRPCSHA